MFFVYVIYSSTHKRRYVGLSSDVKKRIVQHNRGENRSTKAFVPWALIHVEEFETRQEARNREKYLKSGVGREWIDKNVKLAP